VHFQDLTDVEQRVLGCLIEKRWTTPDQYPLSLNALRLACNQSTNRDPVTTYDEGTVRIAAQRLSRYGLTRLASGHTSRAIKYRHLAEEALGLDREALAVLCVLLLRGAQTPGELKSRTDRMASFESLADIERVLGELGERGYARRIARRPGQKEDRFEQLLGGDHDASAGDGSAPAPADAAGSYVPEPEPGYTPGAPVGGYPGVGDEPGSTATDEADDQGASFATDEGDEFAAAPAAVAFGSEARRADALQRRVDALEGELGRLGELEAEVGRLRSDLDDLRAQLGG
jgi:uncharacterized protein